MAVVINEGTQSAVATDQVGTLNYQVIKVDMGTAGVSNPFSGTIPQITNIAGGTVTVSNPTGTTIQFNNGTIDLLKTGTINRLEGGTLTRVSTIGTLELGTVTLTNPTGTTVQFINGTVDLLKAGTITKIEGGTLATNLLPLAGVVHGTSVAIGTTATAIPASPLASRKSIIFYNLGTSRIWLTGSGGIGSTGIPVGTADYSPAIDVGTSVIYGVADTAGGTVTTFEVS